MLDQWPYKHTKHTHTHTNINIHTCTHTEHAHAHTTAPQKEHSCLVWRGKQPWAQEVHNCTRWEAARIPALKHTLATKVIRALGFLWTEQCTAQNVLLSDSANQEKSVPWWPEVTTRTSLSLQTRHRKFFFMLAIGRFSEAGLLDWMRFVIFRARSHKRSQRTSRPISE